MGAGRRGHPGPGLVRPGSARARPGAPGLAAAAGALPARLLAHPRARAAGAGDLRRRLAGPGAGRSCARLHRARRQAARARPGGVHRHLALDAGARPASRSHDAGQARGARVARPHAIGPRGDHRLRRGAARDRAPDPRPHHPGGAARGRQSQGELDGGHRSRRGARTRARDVRRAHRRPRGRGGPDRRRGSRGARARGGAPRSRAEDPHLRGRHGSPAGRQDPGGQARRERGLRHRRGRGGGDQQPGRSQPERAGRADRRRLPAGGRVAHPARGPVRAPHHAPRGTRARLRPGVAAPRPLPVVLRARLRLHPGRERDARATPAPAAAPPPCGSELRGLATAPAARQRASTGARQVRARARACLGRVLARRSRTIA